jgi:hypothetical protein
MARAPFESKNKSRQQLRRFKPSSTPLLFVLFPLIPALLFVAGVIELNTQEKGVGGFLTALLATALSPLGIVVYPSRGAQRWINWRTG